MCGTMLQASIWPDLMAPIAAPTFCSGLKDRVIPYRFPRPARRLKSLPWIANDAKLPRQQVGHDGFVNGRA